MTINPVPDLPFQVKHVAYFLGEDLTCVRLRSRYSLRGTLGVYVFGWLRPPCPGGRRRPMGGIRSSELVLEFLYGI